MSAILFVIVGVCTGAAWTNFVWLRAFKRHVKLEGEVRAAIRAEVDVLKERQEFRYAELCRRFGIRSEP